MRFQQYLREVACIPTIIKTTRETGWNEECCSSCYRALVSKSELWGITWGLESCRTAGGKLRFPAMQSCVTTSACYRAVSHHFGKVA